MPFEFRTVVHPGKYQSEIDVGSKIFLMGSCFTDNIGSKFLDARLQALVNPFGVLYNPFSIARLLERVKEQDLCQPEELVLHNGVWHHFDFHGRFSHPDQHRVCEQINNGLEVAANFLENTDFLVLTFGTSFVYERADTSEVVANCHKFPEDYFNRYRLDPEEIISLYKELIIALRVFNPGLKIVFTVSPVRHWKDGAHANQVSKSSLFLAIDKLCDLFDKVWYFPAYEIMMDELRDYRFYDDDMFNPSNRAVDYIWYRFSETLLSEKGRQFIKRTARILKSKQ